MSTDKLEEPIGNDKGSSKSEESQPTLDEVAELAKSVQRGMTRYTQEWNERLEGLENTLGQFVEQFNKKSGAQEGDDEYLTLGKAKQLLAEIDKEKETKAEKKLKEETTQKQKFQQYVDRVIDQLKTEKIIVSKEEEDDFIKFAIETGATDLLKAADVWQKRVKKAKDEWKKELAKQKVKQEEGLDIGTSSKTPAGEEKGKGINYEKMKEMTRRL